MGVSRPRSAALPQDQVTPRVRRRPPQGRRDRPEQGNRGRPERHRQMRNAGVVADHQRRPGDQRGQFGQAGPAREQRLPAQPSGAHDLRRQRPLGRVPADDHGHAPVRQSTGDLGEPRRGPAPAAAGRPRVNYRRTADPGRPRGPRQPQGIRVSRYPPPGEQPAPAGHLVLLLVPLRTVHPGIGRRGVHHRDRRAGRPDQVVAGRPVAVQVDRDRRRRSPPRHRLQLPDGQHPVDRAGQRGQRGELRRGGQHGLVAGVGGPQGPVGGHAGEEVAETEGSQHQHRRPRHRTTSASSRSQSARNRASP